MSRKLESNGMSVLNIPLLKATLTETEEINVLVNKIYKICQINRATYRIYAASLFYALVAAYRQNGATFEKFKESTQEFLKQIEKDLEKEKNQIVSWKLFDLV